MSSYGSYHVAKNEEGNYSVYYRHEYIGDIIRKGVAHFEIGNIRFDRLYLAVKHIVITWIENKKLEKE